VPTEPHPSRFLADEDPATVLGGDETFPAQLGDGLTGGVAGSLVLAGKHSLGGQLVAWPVFASGDRIAKALSDRAEVAPMRFVLVLRLRHTTTLAQLA
jgi:hypothetical protein